MSDVDIFTDPSFAGLHWSIPPDTPLEDRARAHRSAAFAARVLRDRREARTVRTLLKDVCRALVFVEWANGSRTWMSEIDIAAMRLIVKPAASERQP